MPTRNTLIFFIVSFLLGMGGAYLVDLKTRPSEAQQLQRLVDQTIRDQLCDRMQGDISKFKETPHSFLRSSFQSLVNESRVAAKTLLPESPDGVTIQYKGETAKLLSSCEREARQWARIPTAFPEKIGEDLATMGLPQKDDAPSTGDTPAPSASATGQDKRVALVIGNSKYRSRPLQNPANDAKDIAAFLRSAHFDVRELYDLDLAAMRREVADFSQSLPKYEIALVYYSGHGIEFGGRNYFLPVDADIQAEDEIPRQAFDVTEISERISKRNAKTSIFIIDACRNSPVFSKFRGANAGLKTMEAATGTIIAFSAAPGQVASDGNGRNSVYTAALLKEMRTPGRKIEDVLKETRKAVTEESGGRQVPWYNSSLAGDFFFIAR